MLKTKKSVPQSNHAGSVTKDRNDLAGKLAINIFELEIYWFKRKYMQRLAFKMRLKKGNKKAYVKRHDEIWPELKQLLKEAGVSEYSIFLDHDTNTLFAFQKVSGTGGSQDLVEDSIVRKWWDHMADIMEVNPDNSPISIPLEEVFYMD